MKGDSSKKIKFALHKVYKPSNNKYNANPETQTNNNFKTTIY